MRYHRVFDVHAGPSGQHQDFLFDGIYVNGALVKVRMLRYTIGGSSASASQIASVVSGYEHPKPGDVFEAPWSPRYATHYRDAIVRDRTISFTATDASYGHGNGTFTYGARDDVLAYSYAPTVMPQHATSGNVHGIRAQVLPGYWAMTSETQTYLGHYSLFSAAATVSITQSRFRRFSTLRAAQAFVAADRL